MLKFTLTLLLLTIPLLLKGVYIDNFVFRATGSRFLGFSQVLANDAMFYGLLLGLLYFSVLPQMNRWLAVLFRLLALNLWGIYIIDYIVLLYFNTHLTIDDTLKYAKNAYAYIQQTYDLNGLSIFLICTALILLVLGFLFNQYKITNKRYRNASFIVIACLPLMFGFADNSKYVHSWIYKNVIDYNLTILSDSAQYSDEFIKSFHYDEASHCQAEQPANKNIILLMVESLSAYQSQYFSGIYNWTPNLDAIARQGQAFKNFYANGFITEDGEIALLTGLHPIYPPSSYSAGGSYAFRSFFNIKESLPNSLKKYGYQSDFLTTANLKFSRTGDWAKSIGFDYVEGHEHPEYKHWKRFQFEAAPDEALYVRALDRVKQHALKNFFIFIKTVSSHHPYVNPENKHKSEAETIQYTDKQIGRFYQKLQESGFFNNGLLVIVGDHHAMTPLRRAEFDLYGQLRAAAKIPLVIVGGAQADVDNHQYQQIDVFNSLQGMVSGKHCFTDWQGILLGQHKMPPKYIVYRRGDNRDLISIFTEKDDFLVKNNGDDTRLFGNQPTAPLTGESFVKKVNALRIARIQKP